ncbi:MAG: heme ABC exporter ATP-binding protein CcmA [Sneathiellaceae bacterium]
MSQSPPFFRAENLACARGERAVFRDVSLRLEPGGALLLRGPNGSGKSSLLRVLAGLLPPFAGHLAWHDGAVADAPDRHTARLVYLGHANALQPALTVVEILTFWARLQPGGDAGRVPGALAAFALRDLAELPARYLSAGQGRRLALARLLLGPAPLWLLDEPATGLDRDATDALWAQCAIHRGAGGMVIAAVHGPAGLPDARELDLAPHSLTAAQDDAWAG